MSLAKKVNASRIAAKQEAEEKKAAQQFENRHIARTLDRARKNKTDAFPSDDIETLTELAYKVVA